MVAQEARGWISSLPVYYLYGEGVEIGGRARQARTSPPTPKESAARYFPPFSAGKFHIWNALATDNIL